MVARAAHAMALESSKVVADVVEVQEFPYLAQRYKVHGVPLTVINDSVQFSGAVPDIVLMERILGAVGELDPDEDSTDVPEDEADSS